MLEKNNLLRRRKTDQQNLNKNTLNISKVKEFKHSITITKQNTKNNKKNAFKKNSNLNKFRSNKRNSPSLLNDSRNTSLHIMKAQTQKYIDTTNLKNEDFIDNKNNIGISVSSNKLNKLDLNIKQKLNIMKLELEKNNKKISPIKIMSIAPIKLRKLNFKL
jgi:hypothetical protein